MKVIAIKEKNKTIKRIMKTTRPDNHIKKYEEFEEMELKMKLPKQAKLKVKKTQILKLNLHGQ